MRQKIGPTVDSPVHLTGRPDTKSAPHDSSQASRPHRRDHRCRHGARGLPDVPPPIPAPSRSARSTNPVNLSNIAGGGQGVAGAQRCRVHFSARRRAVSPSWPSYDVSEDGLTYTFRLRRVTFSDGSSLMQPTPSINRVGRGLPVRAQVAAVTSPRSVGPQIPGTDRDSRSARSPCFTACPTCGWFPEGFDSQTETDGTGPVLAGRVDEARPRPQGPRSPSTPPRI